MAIPESWEKILVFMSGDIIISARLGTTTSLGVRYWLVPVVCSVPHVHDWNMHPTSHIHDADALGSRFHHGSGSLLFKALKLSLWIEIPEVPGKEIQAKNPPGKRYSCRAAVGQEVEYQVLLAKKESNRVHVIFSVPSWACRSRSENVESKRHFRELYILYIHMIQPYLNGTFGESTYYLLLDRRAKQVVSRYMVPIQALRSLSAGSITGEWITNGKDIFFNAFNAYNLAIVYFFSFVEEICAIDDLKVLLFFSIPSVCYVHYCRSDLCASLAVTTILVQPIVDIGGGGIREQLVDLPFAFISLRGSSVSLSLGEEAIDRHIGSLVRLIRSFRKGNDMKENEIQQLVASGDEKPSEHNSNISTALFSTGGWFTRRTLLNTALGWSENQTKYNSLLSASWVGSLE
ncbi:hypothetical protein ACJX0J_041894, partial [Zea mays]